MEETGQQAQNDPGRGSGSGEARRHRSLPVRVAGRLWGLVRLAWSTSVLKTIRFNLHYFPLRTAVHLPVLISRRVCLRILKGRVTIEGPIHRGMFMIGYPPFPLFDEKRSRTMWGNEGEIILRGPGEVSSGGVVSVGEHGRLTLGANLLWNEQTSVICRQEITIGDDCMIGWEVMIMDSDSHEIRSADGRLLNANRPVLIGDHVWIASRCIVLKGTTIPDGTVVAIGSTVSGKLEEGGHIIGGSPPRVLKSDVRWSSRGTA